MQDLFLQGLDFHRRGLLHEAEALYLRTLAQIPEHANTLHQLGLLRRQQQRHDEALALLRRAVEANPGEAVFHSNLGNALRDQGAFAGALQAYRESIRLKPEFAQAHNNLGVLLLRRRRAIEAVVHLEKAVELAPTFVDAINNLGFACHELGRIEQAMTCYRRAIFLQPAHQDALYNLGNSAIGVGDYDQARAYLFAAGQVNSTSRTGQASWVRQALVHYLQDDAGAARAALARAGDFPDEGQVLTYRRYIAALLDCMSVQPERAATGHRIHVIGESHALGAHGMAINVHGAVHHCHSWWIEGCKQWHLANDQANRFKVQFSSIVDRLPQQSWLLLAIGEIDCRADEGLLPAWRKAGQVSLASMIDLTVGRFVDYALKITASRGHKLVFCGVPAPVRPGDPVLVRERLLLAELIGGFNEVLQKKALAAGHHFLDVFGLTVGQDGFSNGIWHLDAHHLRPSAWSVAAIK